jgi:hypothetical protein
MVKYLAMAIVGMLWIISSTSDGNAAVCARGVYRAGCIGPYGAVGVRRPIAPYYGRRLYGGPVVRRRVFIRRW